MAIIRGDRIGDGRKTSPLSAVQQDAYARFVATLPDDFGRVRLSWTLIVGAMYPREENPRKVAGLAGRWRRFADAFEAAGLLRVWEDDGIRWAEVVGWKPSQHKRGQAFHRTPEPPWGGHVHTGWCASTAIARLRDVGQLEKAEELAAWLKDFKTTTRSRDGKLMTRKGGNTDTDHDAQSPDILATNTSTGATPVESLHVGSGADLVGRTSQVNELGTRERVVKGVVKGVFTSPPSLPSPPPPPPLIEQRTVPPLAAESAKPRGGWVGRVLDLWPGVVDGGHVGKVLKPVVVKYGEAQTLEGLKRWLEAGKAAFGPEVFAREAEAWIKGQPPTRAGPPGRASVGDRSLAALERFAARRRDGAGQQVIDIEGGEVRGGPDAPRGELPAGGRRPDP